jgi:2-methylisocitrate lyase-like PEP mutase family enzyme
MLPTKGDPMAQAIDLASEFRRLHEPGRILVLPNAWDAASARVLEECGAKAIATTSAGVAWSHGYPDGDAIPKQALLATATEIVRATRLPVSADVESGYASEPERVAETVSALLGAGIVGINLEDGAAPPDVLAAKIEAVKRAAERAGIALFVNARTDVYLRGLAPKEKAVDETLARAARYREAGCDGIFVPGVVDAPTIRVLADAVALPLNVMVRPALPTVAELAALGVRRVSAGSALCQATLGFMRRAARKLLEEGGYGALLEGAFTHPELNALFARP